MARQPPYARAIRARLAAGLAGVVGTSLDGARGTLWVLIGPQVWELARAWQADRLATLLPPGEAPDSFDWHGVVDPRLDVLVSCAGLVPESDVLALAVEILSAGARWVLSVPSGIRYLPRRVAA